MSVTSRNISRRQMLGRTAGAGAAVLLPAAVRAAAMGRHGVVAPSDKIVLGAIGIGGRGQHVLSDMMSQPDVRFVAICDVREERRQAVKRLADGAYGDSACATYRDLRDILTRQDIDAVLIATGDRWHTLASIIAARAGKDVFCEKPCSMTIEESRALADTMARMGRVYQAGTQRRNVGNFVFAAHLAHSGRLGRLTAVHANTRPPPTTHEWLPAEPEPPKDVVDWDLWLGPCPWRPYNSRYVRGAWRGFFDFHGGGILEWGSHTVDLCQWAAQADHTAPVEYEPRGDGVAATYAGGLKLIMRTDGWLGLGTCSVRFEGEEGWVEAGDSGRVQVHPASLRVASMPVAEAGTSPLNHVRDFLNCVKTRNQPRASAAVACQSHIACHAAYIAWQLDRPLKFDPKTDAFVGDDQANRMRSRALREPWRL